jgi:hypothetical protein
LNVISDKQLREVTEKSVSCRLRFGHNFSKVSKSSYYCHLAGEEAFLQPRCPRHGEEAWPNKKKV